MTIRTAFATAVTVLAAGFIFVAAPASAHTSSAGVTGGSNMVQVLPPAGESTVAAGYGYSYRGYGYGYRGYGYGYRGYGYGYRSHRYY